MFAEFFPKSGRWKRLLILLIGVLLICVGIRLYWQAVTTANPTKKVKPPTQKTNENPAINDEKKKDTDIPFEISSQDVIFEIAAGGFVRLTPKKPLKEDAQVKIELDDPSIIETIGSFKVEAGSIKPIFIPIHGKSLAGHCVMSFTSKSKELEHIFKLQVRIKAVHEIMFGYLSILLGWGYFCMWSLVYYPQIYQNYKRQSVLGFSFDYLALNMTGHLCYCVFNTAMYYNSSIQRQYTSIHLKGELPVKINDVLFSLHAITMNCILIMQCLLYERGEQKISTPMITLVGGIWVSMLSGLFASIAEKVTWLQYVYFLSYIKVGTTPVKYTPQVYLHFLRKSTEGWSIHSVMLDFCGGSFSFLQMGIDAINNDDWDGTWGNPGKLGLSIIAMIYDSIFMLQHFCLYSISGAEKRKLQEQSGFHRTLEKLQTSLWPQRKPPIIYDL